MPIFLRDPKTNELVPHHTGRVIKTFHADYHAMSDVYTWALYATYLTEDLMRTETMMVNACFECDQSGNYATEDLSPENQLMLQVIEFDRAEKAKLAEQARRDAARKQAEEAERNRPVKGKRMEVTRGRKVKPGTVGVVFWAKDGRVGLDVTGKRDARGYAVDPVFVPAEYLRAV